MEPTNELLVCRDVSLGYEGQSVLEHLDLTIRRGDYLCIVGDNGSGKSTLLRGLLGLIQPLSGEIWRSPELRQGSLGYLPQQTRAQRDFPPRCGRGSSLAASTARACAFSTPPPRNPRPS